MVSARHSHRFTLLALAGCRGNVKMDIEGRAGELVIPIVVDERSKAFLWH
jgi:hypothetical protein